MRWTELVMRGMVLVAEWWANDEHQPSPQMRPSTAKSSASSDQVTNPLHGRDQADSRRLASHRCVDAGPVGSSARSSRSYSRLDRA